MEDKVRSLMMTRFADAVIREDNFCDQQSFYVQPEKLVEICEALKDDSGVDVQLLSDITSLDWLNHDQEKHGRFEVIYNLYSLTHQYRFFLKVHLPADKPHIASLTDLWNGANWLEREVYDLMGIVFDGHPDLTRILTPDDFEGHPLRKDFPQNWEQPVFGWNKDDPPEVIN